jgi:hypothetical protein
MSENRSGPGAKPSIKVSIRSDDKTTKTQSYSLGAAWRDNGKLSGKWDRRLKSAVFTFDDGKVITVKPNERGYMDHYFNVYDEDASPSGGYSAQPSKGGGYGGKPSGGAPPADEFPPDDFGGDDVPF